MALTNEGIARGFETRTVSHLAAELVSRALEAMELAAPRIEERLRQSAEPYRDSGEMSDSISVTPFGGLSGFGARQVGLIASASAPQAALVDKGTGPYIYPSFAPRLHVGQRAPNRRNAPTRFKGSITYSPKVNGQFGTYWFSAPDGIPLGEIMRNTYAGIFRRLR